MTTLDGLLAGIVSDPLEETRWLVLADWLEENDDLRRGELLRLHRKLLATCCKPDKHPERTAWHERIVELIATGVYPCVPQKAIALPGPLEMQFSFIPPGSFLMGSENKEAHEFEKPVHQVKLVKGFYLGQYPVTQVQWHAVMKSSPSEFKGKNRPVEQVSWKDCQAFCKKLTEYLKGVGEIRLPTEAEWEYACRAGTTSQYYTGDGEAVLRKVGWFRGNSDAKTHPVGELLANAWSLHDMHGNVNEWCSDWYDHYSSRQQTDPRGPAAGSVRAFRGGGSYSSLENCRSASRGGSGIDDFDIGFRVALIVSG